MAHAKVHTKTIPYQDGDRQLEGHVAWDNAIQGKRPGVLVVHEWWGKDDQASRTQAKLLIAHGNADPFITEDHITQFRKKLDDAGVDWQMVLYAGARHSFTNPGADKHGMAALQYDKDADQRSWRHMQLFFDEIFQGAP